MDKEWVIYKGQRMVKGWPEKIEAAQLQTSVIINGKKIPRIRYGEESISWGAEARPCRDCGITKGELHVVGCDVEQCAFCGRQAITCDCEFADESNEPSSAV